MGPATVMALPRVTLADALSVRLASEADEVVEMFPLTEILPTAVSDTEPAVLRPLLLTLNDCAFEKFRLPTLLACRLLILLNALASVTVGFVEQTLHLPKISVPALILPTSVEA